jgi:phosphatidate phosphatase APP1
VNRLREIAHHLALRVEALWERLRDRLRPMEGPPVLEPYRGIAGPGGVLLRGRVLKALRRAVPEPGQSRWRNALQMVGLFLTREGPGVPVALAGGAARTVSDAEGYVELLLEEHEVPPGWSEVALEIEGTPATRVAFPVFRSRPGARVGVISDVDDTVLETGAHSLMRNLWTTFTGSILTRRIFPDAVVLIDHLAAHGRNPVYYVSSSPWNMHGVLEQIFSRAALEAGPLFLRDYGLGPNKFVTGPHDRHKSAAIDRILAANPGLPFILIGDTGQDDAQIYLDACRRHGGRIIGVVLRETGGKADDEIRQRLAQIRAMGATVAHGPTLDEAAAVLERAGIGPWGRRA